MHKKLASKNLLIDLVDIKQISLPDGDVMHVLKKSEDSFSKFGEVYFSWIKKNKIKGWKKQQLNTMNLVVPIGMVKFVFFKNKIHNGVFSIIIGEKNYKRITVPPNMWYGFKNMASKDSLILNFIDHEHDSNSVDNKNLEYFDYNWD